MKEFSFLNPTRAIHAANIHQASRVVDFDSGSGFFTRAAARAVGSGGTVWSVDSNSDLLSRTKTLAALEGLHNIELVRGNIERRGGSHLPDRCADVVIAANVLFSIEDKHAMVEELWRVLKPLGRALIIDWQDSFSGLGPHPSHIITEQAARTLFESGGFTFVEKIPAGDYHWGMLVRKKE